MSFFDDLPNELVESILFAQTVGYKELCSFALCCKRFYDLVKDDNLWKRKAHQRWKFWNSRFHHSPSWHMFYQRRHQVEGVVKKELCIIAEKCDLQAGMAGEEHFGFLKMCLDEFGENSYLYLNDAFQTILEGTESSQNLTQKYFATKGKVFLTRILCKADLQAFLENTEQIEHLEEGATIIARWMCPLSNIRLDDISRDIDDIAEKVREKLNPAERNITIMTEKTVQLNVLKCLQDVFYKQLKFCGNKENYYNLSNSYINEVLKTKRGIPITLSILFQGIARRLGLCIQPVNCPGHFLVRWKYFDVSVNKMKYRHIDCFNEGVFLDQTHLPHSLSPRPAPPPKQVLKRMMLNIIYILQSVVERDQLHMAICSLSHALDLFMILAPDHVEMTRLNARIKLYLRIKLDEVVASMESLISKQSTHHFEDKRLLEVAKQQNQALKKKKKPEKVKLRSNPKNAEVTLKVGTIMHHRRFDYRCVVYGWDRVCKMPEEWMVQMGVDNLTNGRNQPFYNVLVSDGTERYASQESLGPEAQIRMITHPNVGLYFKEFVGDRYFPNDQLQRLYPEDLTS